MTQKGGIATHAVQLTCVLTYTCDLIHPNHTGNQQHVPESSPALRHAANAFKPHHAALAALILFTFSIGFTVIRLVRRLSGRPSKAY